MLKFDKWIFKEMKKEDYVMAPMTATEAIRLLEKKVAIIGDTPSPSKVIKIEQSKISNRG